LCALTQSQDDGFGNSVLTKTHMQAQASCCLKVDASGLYYEGCTKDSCSGHAQISNVLIWLLRSLLALE
jgi:hypothetical protein